MIIFLAITVCKLYTYFIIISKSYIVDNYIEIYNVGRRLHTN